jgi:hypothetical protein
MKFFQHSTKPWTIAALMLLSTPAVAIGLAAVDPSPPDTPRTEASAWAQRPLPQPSGVVPAPPAPPAHLEGQRPTPYGDARQFEKAERELRKAREEAFAVQYLAEHLAEQVSSADAVAVATIAADILQQAEASYAAGQFFQADKQAKAAKDTYEAAETLYEAELGYAVGREGPRGPSRSYYDAPDRAQERIARAQAELDYYQGSSPIVADLMQQATALARSTTQAQVRPVGTDNFGDLARSRAAEHLAKAAIHLMEAERGF